MTHTPRPWIAYLGGDARWFVKAAHGFGREVARLWADPESEANAHLIAAAPDMLAALKQAEDAVMFVRDQFLVHSAPHHDGLRGWTGLQETIQDAIAKATNTKGGNDNG